MLYKYPILLHSTCQFHLGRGLGNYCCAVPRATVSSVLRHLLVSVLPWKRVFWDWGGGSAGKVFAVHGVPGSASSAQVKSWVQRCVPLTPVPGRRDGRVLSSMISNSSRICVCQIQREALSPKIKKREIEEHISLLHHAHTHTHTQEHTHTNACTLYI